jgi:electron transfer flavoprotein beta subunit
MELPAAVTVVKAIASPRLPTLRGKQRARKTDIPVWGAADLDVESECLGLSGSPTRVVKIFRPQVARECEKLSAGDDEAVEAAADRVIEFLTDAELI